jgi:hypothetical protein
MPPEVIYSYPVNAHMQFIFLFENTYFCFVERLNSNIIMEKLQQDQPAYEEGSALISPSGTEREGRSVFCFAADPVRGEASPNRRETA